MIPLLPITAPSYWPASADAELRDTTCGGVLRDAARVCPDHIALIVPARETLARETWTYRELLRAAEAVAQTLLARFAPGDHIAIYAANSARWVIAQFGIALAGMVLVTANPGYRPEELAYVLRQSRSRGIFYQSVYRGVDMRGVIEQACRLARLTLGFRQCLDEIAQDASAAEFASELPSVKGPDPAMLQYTSGTTGQPKGALLTHHSVTNTSRIMAQIKQLCADAVNLAVAPLFHTGGCVANVLGTVQANATLVIMDAFDADRMLDLVERERATYLFAVPTMCIALIAAQTARPRDVSSLRMVFSGGTVVPSDLVVAVERTFDVKLIIGYGLTESSPAITHTRPDDSLADKSETIGKALPLLEVKIIDPAAGGIVPLGRPGELCVRGFNVMLGYYDMPEATAAAIDAERWLHTGDLCAMDARGYCRVTGRLKDMIIRGGENIYPREIEELIFGLPGIANVAVFAAADEYWGEQVACAVSWSGNERPSGEALSALLKDRLARHKVPKHWFALEELPMTASGKIQKHRLADLFRSGELERSRI